MKSRALGLLAVGLLAGPTAANAVVVHTADFIADGSRSKFIGFEGLPAVDDYGAVHVGDGVVVTQVNGEPNDIWTV